MLALGGWLGNFALSLADHAQNAFVYWPEWITVVGSAVWDRVIYGAPIYAPLLFADLAVLAMIGPRMPYLRRR